MDGRIVSRQGKQLIQSRSVSQKSNVYSTLDVVFQKIDCIRIQVSDIDSALSFYMSKLGMELIWKVENREAGLKIGDTDSELVLVKEELGYPEVDFMVDSVFEFIGRFEESGGKVLVDPFDIKIGKCTVVEDPWKNRFVILDRSKGLLRVDKDKNVL